MTKITIKPDCGNSPKMQLIKELNTAFAKNDAEKILSLMHQDIEWKIVGDQTLHGKEAVATHLESFANSHLKQFTLETVLSHGKYGMGSGILLNEEGTRFGFCDVIEFESHAKNALIISITSYVIAD